jgi:hypothetical protein
MIAVALDITEILVLLSLFMAAPAMFALIWAASSGTLARSERARSLPLRHPEKDFWDDRGSREARGGERQ